MGLTGHGEVSYRGKEPRESEGITMRGLTKKQLRLVVLVAAAKRLSIKVDYDLDSLVTSYRVSAATDDLRAIAYAMGA